MTSPNCVDMSRWGGELSPAEASCMRSAGVTTVIVASGPGGYGLFARQQAEAALAAGLRLEAYTFLEFESDPAWWVREALARLDGLAVARWWLDIEDTAHGGAWSADQRIAYAQRALDAFAAAGVFAHIYSGGWFWRPSMADTAVFARQGRKLWNSWYDGDPDIDGLPYGGWTAADVAIEQFTGTSEVCGQSVDRNWLYFSGDQEEGEEMDLRARIERLERLIGGNGIDDEGGTRLTGEDALAWMDARGLSLHLGLVNTQRAQAAGAALAPHEHAITLGPVRLLASPPPGVAEPRP
ncbi:MAG: GH25 family lysozyme [Tepidiformaceae bacterium]